MIRTKQVGEQLIIYLRGRLDVQLSAEVEREINEILEKHPKGDVVINLAEVEYMSSSGLRVLVAVMRILKANSRRLKLCQLNSPVRKIFEVVELMDMFDIYETEEEALAS
ncbi:MAG: STAS domain-containing protein [Leptospiraceae bacterium]|nr:STAS domain-containing protein [Leptospiraceae bacterium]MDW8306108.1 STAS domain-containing protein [Leptospiraceae bacterium]